jgi:GTP pyrophosphokinase
MPKPNGYRSLHTTVIGPENKIIEFQIRTEAMHKENEFGIASHWAYKEKKGPAETKREMEWVSQLKDWQEKFAGAAESDPEGFLQAMKIDFFKDRIFAMTPRGEIIDLPAGSTVVDFAYHVHSEVGDSASAGKVNSAFVPLSYELKSGDMVEVITQKGKKPSEDWLQFVKSAAARDHIRAALRRGMSNIKLPDRIEFRLTAKNEVGLFKSVSAILARSHFNINDLQIIHQTPAITMLRILVDGNDITRAQKTAIKIKTEVPIIKEISAKLVTK